jgi:hypothetical protein
MNTPSPIIGAHMSALLSLRSRSLQAYGIDPTSLMQRSEHDLIELSPNKTRALAKIAKESRALAVESEHHLTVV